jgi:RNA polymerase sigma-70 factor (ECF subfamily)
MVLSDLDRDLLHRCLAKSEGAWEAFIDRYLALITHVVSVTLKSKYSETPDQVRDDMVSEILLALVDDDFAILRRFRGQSSLGTYLVVVARRIAARRLAKLGVQLHLEYEPAADETDFAVDNQEEVQSLLAELPETEATAIRMFHLEHRSYGDIGTHMGIPENSVGPLLSKARSRIRNLRKS